MLLRNKKILCLGGLDPSGHAGLIADLRMLHWLGAQTAAMVTINTSQSRLQHQHAESVSTDCLQQQWQALLQDAPPDAIKIGAIAPAQAEWLIDALHQWQGPLVIDPVLHSSLGTPLGHIEAYQQLAPLASLLTPNQQEAAALLRHKDLHTPPKAPWPLFITGADEAQQQGLDFAKHHLHVNEGSVGFQSPLKTGRYRGTGCLLASAICAALADEQTLEQACQFGLDCVDSWIQNALTYEDGVHLPLPPA